MAADAAEVEADGDAVVDPSPNADRERWNQRYRANQHTESDPSEIILGLQSWLPRQGNALGEALDLAGGAGRHALWLASLGFATTLVDVSDVALQIARERAQDAKLELKSLQRDVLADGMPPGEFDLIVSVLFLHRPLLPAIVGCLRPGGRLIMLQPTKTNLTRRNKPPERFLLADGELPSLLENAGLRILHSQEGWLTEGRHDAVAVAEKPA